MTALRQTSRSRVLPTSRARAWQVLTDPDHAGSWLGPGGRVTLGTPGSRGRLTDPDGSVRHVVVEQVDPERRVVLRWWTERGPTAVPSLVEITLDDGESGTTLRVTETALPDHLAAGGEPVLATGAGS